MSTYYYVSIYDERSSSILLFCNAVQGFLSFDMFKKTVRYIDKQKELKQSDINFFIRMNTLNLDFYSINKENDEQIDKVFRSMIKRFSRYCGLYKVLSVNKDIHEETGIYPIDNFAKYGVSPISFSSSGVSGILFPVINPLCTLTLPFWQDIFSVK